MPKVSKKYIDPKQFGSYVNNLWSAFTLMGSKEDVRLLFKDLFTHTEYKMFAKRLEIARRLLQRQTYEDIEKDLGVTSGTITHVNNILAESGGGLRKVHDKLCKIEEGLLKKKTEARKGLGNPFYRRTRRNTVLGTAIKAGLGKLDEVISRKVKERSAKESLEI